MLAHVVTSVVKARVDESLDAMSVEAPKATRKMPKAEHRIASHHRIAVARESNTTVLHKLTIAAFARKFENPIHQLNRVIPLEQNLRNLSPVQLQAPHPRNTRTQRSTPRAKTTTLAETTR